MKAHLQIFVPDVVIAAKTIEFKGAESGKLSPHALSKLGPILHDHATRQNRDGGWSIVLEFNTDTGALSILKRPTRGTQRLNSALRVPAIGE